MPAHAFSQRQINRYARTLLSAGCLIISTTPIIAAEHFTHRDANGVMVFSDAPVINGVIQRSRYKSFTKSRPSVVNPCRGLSHSGIDALGNRLNPAIISAAESAGISAALIKAVARAESCFNPQAVSVAGAQGLMQLMPGTAAELGVNNVFDIQQNLRGGSRYLAELLSQCVGDIELALAAYNAGPGNVEKYIGVPPFKETQRYIQVVKSFHQVYSSNLTSP